MVRQIVLFWGFKLCLVVAAIVFASMILVTCLPFFAHPPRVAVSPSFRAGAHLRPSMHMKQVLECTQNFASCIAETSQGRIFYGNLHGCANVLAVCY